ncbi:Mediator of RNA polymerase II transcription subunit [Trichinella pseudospiralis]
MAGRKSFIDSHKSPHPVNEHAQYLTSTPSLFPFRRDQSMSSGGLYEEQELLLSVEDSLPLQRTKTVA